MHVVYLPAIVPTRSFPEAGVFFMEQASLFASAGNQVGVFAPAFSSKGSISLTLKKLLSLGLYSDQYKVGDITVIRCYTISYIVVCHTVVLPNDYLREIKFHLV